MHTLFAHDALESHCAVADVKEDSAILWIGTQRPFGIAGEIAGAIGLKSDSIRVLSRYIGGGFGGRAR